MQRHVIGSVQLFDEVSEQHNRTVFQARAYISVALTNTITSCCICIMKVITERALDELTKMVLLNH